MVRSSWVSYPWSGVLGSLRLESVLLGSVILVSVLLYDLLYVVYSVEVLSVLLYLLGCDEALLGD